MISDYGDLGGTYNYIWRGWTFEVSQETVVTHLIGSATSGTFQIALATAQADGTIIEVLGSVDVIGDDSDQVLALATPITLVPGTIYALGSGRVVGSGSFYNMAGSINVTAIEAHPRIQIGTWMPDTGDCYYWGDGPGGFSGAPFGTNADNPRLGFFYQE